MFETLFPESKIRKIIEHSETALQAKFVIENAFYAIVNWLADPSEVKEGPLIAHFTHHKCGTAWFHNSFSRIARRFALKYQACFQDELELDTHIWFQWNSDVTFDTLPPYRGSHMIRDPRDVTVSAYFYHRWSDKDWCVAPRNELQGRSYREHILSLPKEEGILFEIETPLDTFHSPRNIIDSMASWDYSNPSVIELKYEDLMHDPKKLLTRLFVHYGFSDHEIKKVLDIFDAYSFQRRTKRQLGQEKQTSHMRKGIPGDWKCHFTDRHKRAFKDLHGDTLIKLGYETNKDW